MSNHFKAHDDRVLEEAEKWMRKFGTENLEPEVTTLNALILAAGRAGDFIKADAWSTKLWERLVDMTEMRILMDGLAAAGKSTTLYKSKLVEVATTIPTIGFQR